LILGWAKVAKSVAELTLVVVKEPFVAIIMKTAR
jgi:hypothetical protein